MHGTCNLEHCFPTWPFHRKLNYLGKTFRRASHTVWKIACESIFIYLFSNGLIFFSFSFSFFSFFDGVTLNPNITKQEGTAFFVKKVVLFLARITTCKYSVCLQTQA